MIVLLFFFGQHKIGITEICESPTVGSDQLAEATMWLRENGHQALLGSFAVASLDESHPNCEEALEDVLSFMDEESDVWLGWTWWAAGPWWGDYMFTIEPTDSGEDRSQMAVLEAHIPTPTFTPASVAMSVNCQGVMGALTEQDALDECESKFGETCYIFDIGFKKCPG